MPLIPRQVGIKKRDDMGKRILLTFLCLIIIGLSIPVMQDYAYAEDGLYENLDESAKESGDSNLIKYRDNYEIDTEKISFFKDPGSVLLNMSVNFLFGLQKDLTKMVISVFNFSMTLNLSELFKTFLEPFIAGMKGTIFDRFAVFMISICAFIFLVRTITNRQGQVYSGILALLLIIVLAFAFYAHPMELLDGLDSVSTELSNSVMDAPYDTISGKAGSEAGSSTGKSSAVIWNLFVHKPWQIIEFGSVKKAQGYETDILKLKPGSDQRKEKVEELASKEGFFSKTLTTQTGRCITALILLILNIFLIAVIMLFCLLILGYQFLLLVYMMLGIFVFLLALIPYYGMELVKRWGMRMFSTSCIKVLLVFFLSLLMVFMTVIYGFVDEFGLLSTLVIIVVMSAMIYLKKGEIIGLFSNFNISNMNLKTPEQVMNRAMSQDMNAVNGIRTKAEAFSSNREAGSGEFNNAKASSEFEMGSMVGKRRTSGGESFESIRNDEMAKEEQSQDQDIQAFQAVRMPYSTYKQEHADCKTLGDFDQESKEITVLAPMKKASESLLGYTQDLGRFFRRAEELLETAYEKSKEESEEDAAHSGKDPEYGNFVSRTNAVRSLGAGHFDPRDISKTAHMIRNYEEKGGDISQIEVSGKGISYGPRASSDVRRPAGLSAASNEHKESAGISNVEPIRQAAGPSGLEYFKKTFGEEKGEKFYGNMQGKYNSVNLERFTSDEKLSYAQVQRKLKQEESEPKQEQDMVEEDT